MIPPLKKKRVNNCSIRKRTELLQIFILYFRELKKSCDLMRDNYMKT